MAAATGAIEPLVVSAGDAGSSSVAPGGRH
jgi:hypothetical protein